jgi:hypothetical protein
MGMPREVPWLDHLLAAPRREPLRDRLIRAGIEALDFYRIIVPRLMATWPGPPAGGSEPAGPAPLPVMRSLATFLDGEQQEGRLGPCNPKVLTRLFVAALWHYVTLETLGFDREQLMDAPVYVERTVDHLLNGTHIPAAGPLPGTGSG